MDAGRRRRYIQLGIVLAILAVVVQFVLLPALNPATPDAPVQPATGRASARATGRQDGPVEVRLDALSRAATLAGENAGVAQRNPFRMGAATPTTPAGSPENGPTSARPAPQVPTVPQPPPPPQVPPIPYRFIGILSGVPGQGRIAVLTDGKNVVHGRVSQEIEGRYRIVSIGEESLQIEHIDGRGRQTLRLLGQ